MIVVQMGSVGAPRYVAEANRWTSDLANRDPYLWVYNKSTGEMLAESTGQCIGLANHVHG